MRVGGSVSIKYQDTVVIDEAAYVQDLYEDGRRADENVRQRGRVDLSEVTR